jgi:hypothetical protein
VLQKEQSAVKEKEKQLEKKRASESEAAEQREAKRVHVETANGDKENAVEAAAAVSKE